MLASVVARLCSPWGKRDEVLRADDSVAGSAEQDEAGTDSTESSPSSSHWLSICALNHLADVGLRDGWTACETVLALRLAGGASSLYLRYQADDIYHLHGEAETLSIDGSEAAAELLQLMLRSPSVSSVGLLKLPRIALVGGHTTMEAAAAADLVRGAPMTILPWGATEDYRHFVRLLRCVRGSVRSPPQPDLP
jgi:hypothetical protein